jgi:hypothetical protein
VLSPAQFAALSAQLGPRLQKRGAALAENSDSND